MARFPGSPYEAGDIHPIMLANEDTLFPRSNDVLTAVMYVGEVFKALDKEASIESADMKDNPAFDRLADLAVLGLLVERGILRLADG